MSRRIAIVSALVLVAAACQSADTAPTSPSVAAAATTTTTMTSAAVTETTSTTPAATSTSTTPTPLEAVELILTGGPVVTMDPGAGTVEAIAIDGDEVVAVGSADEIGRHRGPETVVVDLQGRTVIPGFVDAHTHLLTDTGGIDVGQPLAFANGITSLAEAFVDQQRLDTFAQAAESGELRVRTSMYLVRTNNCGDDLGRWYEQYPPGEVGDRLRVAGVKIFVDGGTCGPLAVSEPFIEGFAIGPPFQDPDTLAGYVRDADDLGYQVTMHAQGDLAVAAAQDAYAKVLDGRENVLRHRIDHNAIVTPDIVGRYNDLGLVVVLFGSGEACAADAPWTDFYKDNGEEPAEIVAANPDVVFAWHGDDPYIVPVSPLDELFALVTRGAVAEDGTVCDPAPWMEGEGVTVDQGLAMMTTGSAYAIGQEDVVGSLGPGMYADLLVLSDNPLTVPSTDLATIDVLATMIGGTTEFCLPGNESVCPGWEAPIGPTASASASRAGQGPDLVLDGSVAGDSFWSSGDGAPQWIRVDLSEPRTVSRVRFTVFQNPPSDTVHQLDVMVGGEWSPAETFTGFTTTGDTLTWEPSPPMEGVEAIRMTTLSSESWPEWYEISIEG